VRSGKVCEIVGDIYENFKLFSFMTGLVSSIYCAVPLENKNLLLEEIDVAMIMCREY
jgi:hypothetical protein